MIATFNHPCNQIYNKQLNLVLMVSKLRYKKSAGHLQQSCLSHASIRASLSHSNKHGLEVVTAIKLTVLNLGLD